MSGLIRIEWTPDRKRLNVFGAGLAVIGLLAGWGIVSAILVLLGAGVVVSRPFGIALYRVWMGVAWLLATVVSNLLLAALYFGVVTPTAIAMRLAGRDVLRLKRTPAATYWVDVHWPETPDYFERLS